METHYLEAERYFAQLSPSLYEAYLSNRMVTPVIRADEDLFQYGARYTAERVRAIQVNDQSEHRLEHHAVCRKEHIAHKLELPSASKNDMIMQVDNHFQREKDLQKSLTDLRLSVSHTIMAIDQEYVDAVVAVAADPNAVPPVAAVAAQAAVLKTYTTQNWFELTNDFTQTQIEDHCQILNRHPEAEKPVAYSLCQMIVLNNCKTQLRTKVETQLAMVAARDSQRTGGALALYFARQAVVQASQE